MIADCALPGVHAFQRRHFTVTTLPVHDPPAMWKSWRGHGGSPAVEADFSLLPLRGLQRLHPIGLPLFEPITAELKGGSSGE